MMNYLVDFKIGLIIKYILYKYNIFMMNVRIIFSMAKSIKLIVSSIRIPPILISFISYIYE